MSKTETTTGLILAGGAGLRVGGRDKGLETWQGEPLAAHIARRLRPQVARLLISCNRNSDYYASLADATVADGRRGFQGPLAGIEACSPLLSSEFLVVAPCDTPRLPMDLVTRLLAALQSPGDVSADISYAHDGERHHYLCAAIRTRILYSLKSFLDDGHRAVRHWYAQHECIRVDFSDRSGCFANFNRPGQRC